MMPKIKTLSMWAVYDHPKDYPKSYVARLFVIDSTGVKATGSVIITDDLEVLRDVLLTMNLTPIIRNLTDDPCIVETWI